MSLYIRDKRAARLATQLAARKSVSIAQAVVIALEEALAQDRQPLHEHVADIARCIPAQS